MQKSPPSSDLLTPIANIVGPKGMISEDAQDPFLTEWRQRWKGKASMIVAPASTQEVANIVRHCAHHKIAITPQGGNTGLVGGQIPFGHEVLISLNRIRTIHDVSPLDNTMTVDAGVTLSEAQEAAKTQNRLFPLSIGSEGSCQIGGVISTNAGGVNVLRYGNMRDLVMGVEAVMPNGEIWNGLNRLRKNNTGYDLKQLLIGGEGTLGIITKAVLKLFAQPTQTQTIFAGCKNAHDIITLLSFMQEQSGGLVSSFELIERPCIDLVLKNTPQTRDPLTDQYPVYALIELSSGPSQDLRTISETLMAQAFEKSFLADAMIAENLSQRDNLWRIRHSISPSMNIEGIGARHDVSVPIQSIPDFLKAAKIAVEKITPRARIIAFGHAGDGNIHYDIIPPEGAERTFLDPFVDDIEMAIYDVIASFQGSISAEHGIGAHKRDTLETRKSAVEIEMMRAIKNALDPAGIMNPQKMLNM